MSVVLKSNREVDLGSNWKYTLVCIVFLILAIYLLVLDLQEVERRKFIIANGKSANAEFVDKHYDTSSSKSRTYYITFRYTDRSIVTQQVSVEVTYDLYKSTKGDAELPILYLQHDPSQVVIAGEPYRINNVIFLWIFGIVLSGAGIMFFILTDCKVIRFRA